MWKKKLAPLKWEMALLNEAWQFIPKDPALYDQFEINITRADVKVLFSFQDAFARLKAVEAAWLSVKALQEETGVVTVERIRASDELEDALCELEDMFDYKTDNICLSGREAVEFVEKTKGYVGGTSVLVRSPK